MTRFHKVTGLPFAAGLSIALMLSIGSISLAEDKGKPRGGGEDSPLTEYDEYFGNYQFADGRVLSGGLMFSITLHSHLLRWWL